MPRVPEADEHGERESANCFTCAPGKGHDLDSALAETDALLAGDGE